MLVSLLLADWTAYFIAERYGLKTSETEIIDRFKKTMKEKTIEL